MPEWDGEIGRRARLSRVSEDVQVRVLPPLQNTETNNLGYKMGKFTKVRDKGIIQNAIARGMCVSCLTIVEAAYRGSLDTTLKTNAPYWTMV